VAGLVGRGRPFHHPVFVLTHHPRESLQMEGGTSFHFVSDGIDSALRQAKEAADGADVSLPGGASVVNQYLAAGLVDAIDLSIAPLAEVAAGECRLRESVPCGVGADDDGVGDRDHLVDR
jgi:dihydrofolate reductase